MAIHRVRTSSRETAQRVDFQVVQHGALPGNLLFCLHGRRLQRSYLHHRQRLPAQPLLGIRKLLPDKHDEYLGFYRLCEVNIETALSKLPLHLSANDDMIVALTLGVSQPARIVLVFRLTYLTGLLRRRARKAFSGLDSVGKGVRAVPVLGLSPDPDVQE